MKNPIFFIATALVLFGVSFSFADAAAIDEIRQNLGTQLRARQSALTPTARNQMNVVRKQLGVCLSGGLCRSGSSPRIINGGLYIPAPDMRFARGLPLLQPIGRIAPQ